MAEIDPRLMELLSRVTGKRPRTVIDHILEHGFITTDDLKTIYGYDHPPRAARDVREQGIPLETYRVEGPSGRLITAYRFGSLEQARPEKLGGRITIPLAIRDTLYEQQSGECGNCHKEFEKRYLQSDHRIPFEIAGDPLGDDESNTTAFQLLCASCQRSKSWSCEHCPNWEEKIESVCEECYWAHPENYTHIAMENIRRLDLTWSREEVNEFQIIESTAADRGETLQATVKWLIRQALDLLARRTN